MSRYIEKQKILNFCKSVVNKEFVGAFNTFAVYVNTLPTIDIVRCGECKYYYNKDPQQIPTASIMCSHMHPDDFCSYGEREGE